MKPIRLFNAILFICAFAFVIGYAQANQPPSPSQQQSQFATSYGSAGYGGAGGQGGSNQWADSSRMYVFPGVALGGPALPSGLCPMNDRLAWGILWNAFWIDTSTVRTDMQCLEAMLGVMRMTAPKPVVLQPIKKGDCLHPPKKPKMVCKRVT